MCLCVCVTAGRLVETSAIAGVSGHAILLGIITPPITQAHCVHYSWPWRSSSEAVTAGAVTALSITGAHAVCSSDPSVTWQHPPHTLHSTPHPKSSSVESRADHDHPNIKSCGEYLRWDFKMEAPAGSATSATQITTRATHLSSRLSTSAHSWVTDSQGILLTCLFNFREPHNSCCHRTLENTELLKAAEPVSRDVGFHSVAQMRPVILHGDEQKSSWQRLSADKVKSGPRGCFT